MEFGTKIMPFANWRLLRVMFLNDLESIILQPSSQMCYFFAKMLEDVINYLSYTYYTFWLVESYVSSTYCKPYSYCILISTFWQIHVWIFSQNCRHEIKSYIKVIGKLVCLFILFVYTAPTSIFCFLKGFITGVLSHCGRKVNRLALISSGEGCVFCRMVRAFGNTK